MTSEFKNGNISFVLWFISTMRPFSSTMTQLSLMDIKTRPCFTGANANISTRKSIKVVNILTKVNEKGLIS